MIDDEGISPGRGGSTSTFVKLLPTKLNDHGAAASFQRHTTEALRFASWKSSPAQQLLPHFFTSSFLRTPAMGFSALCFWLFHTTTKQQAATRRNRETCWNVCPAPTSFIRERDQGGVLRNNIRRIIVFLLRAGEEKSNDEKLNPFHRRLPSSAIFQ